MLVVASKEKLQTEMKFLRKNEGNTWRDIYHIPRIINTMIRTTLKCDTLARLIESAAKELRTRKQAEEGSAT